MRATIRKATAVAVHGIVAVALLAGCDGDDRAEATKPSTLQRLHAEEHEWSAHLQGQARSHAAVDSTDDAPAPVDARSVDEFVPGSRHMPMR